MTFYSVIKQMVVPVEFRSILSVYMNELSSSVGTLIIRNELKMEENCMSPLTVLNHPHLTSAMDYICFQIKIQSIIESAYQFYILTT